jgi:septal ring factor EnvC (AmiA/AmiB activator)
MTKATQDTEATIEELLEQRSQYEEWLAKLDASGDKAPPAVRQRVRGDYEARLQGVMEQLRNRGAAVSEELERHHATQAELDRERRAAEEALAEAEVRHAVGEYTEDEWRRLSDESRREIEQLRSKLRSVGAEITRLTQVQGVIASPRSGTPAAPPPPPAPQRAAARHEVVEQASLVTHVAEPVEEPEQVRSRFAPKPAQPEPAAAPVDELAFLKSVSDEEPRATRRPSNPAMAAPEMSAPSVGRAQEPAVQTVPTVSKAGVAKTLKCGECGTLNRPTEWYCERCGAELAGV